MLTAARTAKEALSDAQTVPIAENLSDGRALCLTLTRDLFAELTADLVARTLQPTRKALRDAGLAVEEVQGVVLVGGSTRMPQVRDGGSAAFQTAAA